MADELRNFDVVLGPDDVPAVPPYASSAFVAFWHQREVTLVFGRTPPLLGSFAEKAQQTGAVQATVVASVSLHPTTARQLARHILDNIPPIPGEE